MYKKVRRSNRYRAAILALLILPMLVFVAVSFHPEGRWRIDVILLKASGNLPDVEWSWLLEMLRPGSPIYLAELAVSGNPYSVIRNPYESPEDIRAGEQIFRSNCLTCHDGGGHAAADSLFDEDFLHGESDWAIYGNIRDGIPGTAMRSLNLSGNQIWRVLAFIRKQESLNDENKTLDQAAFENFKPVSFESQADIDVEPHNWSTFSGTVDGKRFSRLDQITKDNVSGLKLAWVYQGAAHDFHVEATPIVIDGVLVTSEPPGSVVAIQANTGEVLWRYSRPIPDDIRICCGTVNRGIAVAGSTVFIGTLDAHLLALDIQSGKLLWDVATNEYKHGYSITAAPLVADDVVITGVAGGEFGIRGFIDAYDINSGEKIWRFHTIPAPGEPGSDTWEGNSWQTGGAPTWMTGSIDAESDLVYWGVGNPGPDFTDTNRSGDNLHSNSLVALDLGTGKLEWSFQFTPGDVHDYDANHVPVLADIQIGDQVQKVVMSATKNGFFYVLDAATGEFISALEMTKQNWASSIDTTGRPIRNPAAKPKFSGTRVYPSAAGGANWWPGSFNPNLNIFTVPVLEGGAIFYSKKEEYRRGELFVGGTSEPIPGELRYKSLKAIDPAENKIVWEMRGSDASESGLTGGALSTEAGLVFWGDSDTFYALDGSTGRVLWRANLGGLIVAAPMTYMVQDRQYVAVSAGRGLFVFAL